MHQYISTVCDKADFGKRWSEWGCMGFGSVLLLLNKTKGGSI